MNNIWCELILANRSGKWPNQPTGLDTGYTGQRVYSTYSVDTGRKLNVHKTFRRRPRRVLNVLRTFNLRPVPTGYINVLDPRLMYVEFTSCVL